MSVLNRLLGTLAARRGPVRLDDLARDLGVERSALEGMLDVLQLKGLLERPLEPVGSIPVACAGGCGGTCVGVTACPFVAGVPFSQVVQVRSDAVPLHS